MTTALAVIDPKKIEALDKIAQDYALVDASQSPFAATFTLAQSIGQLRELLTSDVMQPIMRMMNTPLGFLTDRDPARPDKHGKFPEPYNEAVIRDVVIEATLRGFYPAGNEFNVIAGRFYAAKAGIRRRVTTWPGLTDFKDFYEVPRVIGNGGALVKAKATWKLGKTDCVLEREFAIRVNEFMGADAIAGKAERKLLKAVLDRISGIITPDGEADDAPAGAGEDEARFKSAKPAFANVETPAPAKESASDNTTARPGENTTTPTSQTVTTTAEPAQTPATDTAPQEDIHQKLREFIEAQGIKNHEIMRFARGENLCGDKINAPSQLKPEAVEYILAHQSQAVDAVEEYRSQKH